MSKQGAPTTNNEFKDAVDAITAQFYDADGQGELEDNQHGEPPTDAGEPPRMHHYLDFSDSHKGSGNILVGVLLFFILILGVWGFLWYQSMTQVNLADSFEYEIFDTGTDELSAIFQDIETRDAEENARETEAALKSELGAILANEQELRTVLGATATTTTTTSTTNTQE